MNAYRSGPVALSSTGGRPGARSLICPHLRQVSHHRRGVASVLAMLYLMIFSALALGFYTQTTIGAQVSASERRLSEAQIAAEAGAAFVKYHLSALDVPYLAPAQRLEEIYMQLAARLDGTSNLGGGAVGYDGSTIRIPDGTNNYVRLPSGHGFRAVITINNDNTLQAKFVGRYGATTTGVGRGIQLTFNTEQRVAPLSKYGMVARGPVQVSGNGTIRGVPDPAYGTLLITTTANPAITMTGPSEVSGDVYLTNPAATTSINASCIVGGVTGAAINSHVFKIPAAQVPEFPVIDTSVFLPYVTSTYTILSGNKVKNIRIPANTGTALLPLSFASGATVDGVMYIESPNVVKFSGSCNVRGVIVGPNTTSGGIANNVITFAGQVTADDISTLPATSDFPASLRAMTGSSILANGFNVQFSGGYAAISGTLASSQLTFSGTAGGNIKGQVLGMGTQALVVSGSSQVFLERPPTNKWAAGTFFRSRYVPNKDTYLEIPATSVQ